MPIYDYQCSACERYFEARRDIAASSPGCPHCGAPSRRIIVTAPAIHGATARGRDRAVQSIPECGKGCRCCP